MREKKEINIQIGEQVRIAREQVKLTQEVLAEKIEVSPASTMNPIQKPRLSFESRGKLLSTEWA